MWRFNINQDKCRKLYKEGTAYLPLGWGKYTEVLCDMLIKKPKINGLAGQPYLTPLLVTKGLNGELPTQTYDLVLQLIARILLQRSSGLLNSYKRICQSLSRGGFVIGLFNTYESYTMWYSLHYS